MRISKFRVPASITESKGLDSIDVSKLGSVVALVGRNGSGKSRILNLLKDQYVAEISCAQVLSGDLECVPEQIYRQIQNSFSNNTIRELNRIEYELQFLNKNRESGTDVRQKIEAYRAKYNGAINQASAMGLLISAQASERELSSSLRAAFLKRIRKIQYSEIRDLKERIEEKSGPVTLTFEKLIENVTSDLEYNEFSAISNTALNYLSKLPHQLVIDKDEVYGKSEEYESRTSFKRFNVLRKLIKDFLNKDLEWEKEKTTHLLTAEGVTTQSKGIWKLNGRQFNYFELSDGERTLFAYCLLFFLLELNPGIQIKECIIIIDEPELHLHPESELWLINGIRNVIKESGQLWIATHSLSILSSLAHDEIFLVKSGRIFSPNRSTPGRTLAELMGLTDHVTRLEAFISDISGWAYANFMTQCFLEPEVVKSAQPNDPEVTLFFDFVSRNPNGTLLDFGSGKGRILKEIKSNDKSSLNYFALEPNRDYFDELKRLGAQEIYTNHGELPSEKFDFILLCNVLHEIPVLEWEEVLNSIKRSLSDSGFLILIEDLKLPKGERIENHGFLILDQDSFECILDANGKVGRIYAEEQNYKNRILCAIVSKSNIGTITNKSIKKGLQKLQSNTFNSLEKLRLTHHQKEDLLPIGRYSAFLSQLYLNTVFAIKLIED